MRYVLKLESTFSQTEDILDTTFCLSKVFVIVVQLLSCVQLFAIPWTAVHQASYFLEFAQTHVH